MVVKRLLLLLLLALPLAASEPITVIPPGPTTATPVILRVDVWCNPIVSHTFSVVGSTIRVQLSPQQGSCPSPPLPLPYDVDLGRMPSGEYLVEVYIHDAVFKRTFIVRNASPGLVDVHPFAVPKEPFALKLRVTAPAGCAGENCNGVQVNVGGVIVPSNQLRGASDGAIWLNAPPHAPGFVNVSVTAGSQTWTMRNALYYYDPAAPPDPTLWERVLFPVLFDSGGAHGSRWVSEAAIANQSRWYIENYNRIDAEPCIDFGCSQLLMPGSFFPFGGAGYPHGIALLVPRGEAERVAFSLRVRDVARQAEGFGTEVPVVRDSRMVLDEQLTLLDVPIDPRYRTKLRIYAFNDENHGAFVQIQRGTQISGMSVILNRDCTGNACAATPWYGEVDLAPGAAGERVNLYVIAGAPGSLAWTFASVTNNETQQVTIVTPDGIGGAPEVQ